LHRSTQRAKNGIALHAVAQLAQRLLISERPVLPHLAEAINVILGQLNLVHDVTNHAPRDARIQPSTERMV
jgi:hypothetical protein